MSTRKPTLSRLLERNILLLHRLVDKLEALLPEASGLVHGIGLRVLLSAVAVGSTFARAGLVCLAFGTCNSFLLLLLSRLRFGSGCRRSILNILHILALIGAVAILVLVPYVSTVRNKDPRNAPFTPPVNLNTIV